MGPARRFVKKTTSDYDNCNYCLGKGHWKSNCPVLKSKFVRHAYSAKPAVLATSVPVLNQEGTLKGISLLAPKDVEDHQQLFEPFISNGFVSLPGSVEKVAVKILRDTGSSESFILESVLPFSTESHTGSSLLIRGIGLNTLSVPLHKVDLTCELVHGVVDLGIRPILPVDGVSLILGNNLAGGRVWVNESPSLVVTDAPSCTDGLDDSARQYPKVFVACAVTRSGAQPRAEEKISDPESCFILSDYPIVVSREELSTEQQNDETLKPQFEQVIDSTEIRDRAQGYFIEQNVLLRKWSPHAVDGMGDSVIQVVIPVKFRSLVLKMAHDQLAGHAGVQKTYDRILRYFYWPRIKKDVASFIKTCHTCQLTGKPNQSLKPAPLRPIPAVCQPFEHLIIDCVGPLPRSKAGSEYLLTVMCQVTRYPAAYPLRSINTKSIVKALTQFVSIFGLPKIIQSDQGSNFTSKLFAEVLFELGVRHNLSTAYHAQSQGALERFHSTLKSLLRAYCLEMQRDWEEGLPWLMLAAREVTHQSIGFSPNELVFAHKVRGLLAVLRDQWVDSEPPKKISEYVLGFRRRLSLAGELAGKCLNKTQGKMKKLFDRNTEHRKFSVGDQVIALLPVVDSPFQAKYTGPYEIIHCGAMDNYTILTPDRRKKSQVCHVNLLKPYYQRNRPVSVLVASSPRSGISQDMSMSVDELESPDDCVLLGRLKNSETLKSLSSNLKHLDVTQSQELISLLSEFPELFSDVPTQTTQVEHDIEVGEAAPVRQRFYRVPLNKREFLEKEVQYLLDNGLAEPSFSSWSSPCLLVKKSDGTFRFCTDYRKLNSVTRPDSFPLPRMEDCVDQVGAAKFVTKLDLLKGYWQIPLTERAREVSSFITPNGLFSYRVMSFGLRNAPATFQRMMNRVIAGLKGVTVYLDDTIVVSDTWSEHLKRLRLLLVRLSQANLTLNLAKCVFAGATVTYLGKVVGQGQVRPVREKVRAIDEYPVPVTKKELMRFLGLVGFYRCFCRNFSTVVAPLTDLLKAKALFVWSESCQNAFEAVKSLLTVTPVLMAPQLEKTFKIQVDASKEGAGAVLIQEDDAGIERPVCFFSRKFNSHQMNYSTIEKEALALILALQHFEVYVGGNSSAVIVYSDHNPLTFLHSLKNPNQRLMRWCLFLQPFHLDVRHLKGSENIVADALSRAPL